MLGKCNLRAKIEVNKYERTFETLMIYVKVNVWSVKTGILPSKYSCEALHWISSCLVIPQLLYNQGPVSI